MTARERDIEAARAALVDGLLHGRHQDELAEQIVDAIYAARAAHPMSRPIPKSHTPGRTREQRSAAAEWLTAYLAGSPDGVFAGQVQRDAVKHGITLRTLRRAADDMGVIRDMRGGPGTTWALPKDLLRQLKREGD
jgi:hypothetical protein